MEMISFETYPTYYGQTYPFSFTGTVYNGCPGTSQFTFTFVEGPNCGGGYYYSVGPNPVSDVLSIAKVDSVTQKIQLEDVEENEVLEVVLFNHALEKVYSTRTSKPELKIRVNRFPEGLYFLHLYNKDGIIRKEQIIIKR